MEQSSQNLESLNANGAVLKTPNFRALPTGEDNFANLRANNKIYVDKTALIAELASIDIPIFVSRPRRFGKSLLCSTLADLFAYGTENFKGLAIDKLGLWQEPTYPVLYLNFICESVEDDNSNLELAMFNLIYDSFDTPEVAQFLQTAHIDLDEYKQRSNGDAKALLSSVLRKYHSSTKKQFVIIIDEYDELINQAIGNQSIFEERVNWFSKFFNILKGLRSTCCWRFLFITGITRYAHAGILSGFNSLEDITYDINFCTLFGYTEEELQQYFAPYIEYGAQLREITPTEYLLLLRQEYDGYRFDNSVDATKVYNPWSILKSFAELQKIGQKSDRMDPDNINKAFDRFWARTAALPTYFVNFFNRQLQNVQTADNATLNDLIWFMNSDLTQDFSLSQDLFYDMRNPYTMFNGKAIVPEFKVAMIQTGYYTFRVVDKSEVESKLEGQKQNQDHDPQKQLSTGTGSQFLFTVPNQEVAKTLNKTFWPVIKSLVSKALKDVFLQKGNGRRYLLDEMFAGDADAMMTILNERFVILSEKDQVFADEDSLCRQLANILRLLMDAYDSTSISKEIGCVSDIVDITEERRSPKGWADIFVTGKHKNVVFEFKLYRGDGFSCDTLLQRALEQIPNQRYFDQHRYKEAVCYAVVFSQKTCRVERLAVFDHLADGTNTKVRYAETPLVDE